MSPFYPGPSGLIVEENNVPFSGVSVLNFENGSLVQSGGTLSYTAPALTITDGTNTITSISTLSVTNLDLSGAASPPTVVQSVFGDQNQTIQLPNTPANGNILVFISYSIGATTLPGTTRVSYAASGCDVTISTLAVTTGQNPQRVLLGNECSAIYEVSGGTYLGSGGETATVVGSGPYTTEITGIPLSTNLPSLILAVGRSTSTDSPSSLSPSGTVLDSNQSFYNSGTATGVFFRQPDAGSGSTETLSWNTTGNNNASNPVGYIVFQGEFLGSAGSIQPSQPVQTASGSAVALTSGTAANVCSVTLPTAGDYDISASLGFTPAGTTVLSNIQGGLNTTSATLPSVANGLVELNASFTTGDVQSLAVATQRVHVNTPNTVVYLIAEASFTVSTCTVSGAILAREVGPY